MLGYFIDAEKRAITKVEYEYGTMRQYLPGGIEIGCTFEDGDVLYVDEEGLLKKATKAFLILQRPDGQPMMSNGFLTGRDDPDPESKIGTFPPTMTIEALNRQIAWLDLEDALDWFRVRAAEPAVVSHTPNGIEVHAHWRDLLANLEGREGYDPKTSESLMRAISSIVKRPG